MMIHAESNHPIRNDVISNQIVKSSANSAMTVSSSSHTRNSSLYAPTMLLTGHYSAVLSARFCPSGEALASASMDKTILLWYVRGECRNYGVLSGHKNAVLEIAWSCDSENIISASADKVVAMWDVQTQQRIKQWTEHSKVVNCCSCSTKGPMLVASGSDDRTTKLWDTRVKKKSIKSLDSSHQVTAVTFNSNADLVLSGSVDGIIRCWDLRKDSIVLTLEGHEDIITGLALSPNGSHLISNAMDSTLYKWDLRPYMPTTHGSRCTMQFVGPQIKNHERNLLRCVWSRDGTYIAAGSADRIVYIWDADNGRLRYQLPGHTATVNDVCFHPTEPIIGSCSSDKTIYLGELFGYNTG